MGSKSLKRGPAQNTRHPHWLLIINTSVVSVKASTSAFLVLTCANAAHESDLVPPTPPAQQHNPLNNNMAATAPPDLLQLCVKYSSQEHSVILPANSNVAHLKQALQQAGAELLPRQQKLIFKGKVLDDHKALSSYKLVSGSKIMLMAAQVRWVRVRIEAPMKGAK